MRTYAVAFVVAGIIGLIFAGTLLAKSSQIQPRDLNAEIAQALGTK